MKKLILGVVRETKNPPDKRVPLTPQQCRQLSKEHPNLKIVVQPSEDRCYSDQEYKDAGITMMEDLSGCEVLAGVKEVKSETLIHDKTYFFFSHTAKKQPYNRGLLQDMVKKGIRMIDYEYLTGDTGVRVVAFGKWAGVVGAYNGLIALGLRSGRYVLPRANDLKDLKELKAALRGIDLGKTRLVITGGGRVAEGAVDVLKAAGIQEVEPGAYLSRSFDSAVFTRLDPWHYTKNRFGERFDFNHFIANPHLYENNFLLYARRTDMYIACHFWNPRSPVLLTRENFKGGKVPIRIIADISCDIDGPIASTIRSSTIADPFYGYDPLTGDESESFDQNSISVMAVDNLPGELPRDASSDFGAALARYVIPELLTTGDSEMLERATLTQNGGLGSKYGYLLDFLEGR
jgi:saccharopine dehydrogenase (NAD+, L-lysine-forming)